jgi:exodeoxyribonuclease VII small subunit
MCDEDTSSYGRVRERLEEIVVQIRSKDVPLEKSLDLYEEALRLGGMAADLIDNTDFSVGEMSALGDDEEAGEGADDADDAADADDDDDDALDPDGLQGQ